MAEDPEASVLTATRVAQHVRLFRANDAYEHLYILTIRPSLGPSPPYAGRYTVASRFRRRSCERGYYCPRAPEQFVTSPLCLVGYVRWDARSDRVPPLQTIIFSSFPGRTPVSRLHSQVNRPTASQLLFTLSAVIWVHWRDGGVSGFLALRCETGTVKNDRLLGSTPESPVSPPRCALRRGS